MVKSQADVDQKRRFSGPAQALSILEKLKSFSELHIPWLAVCICLLFEADIVFHTLCSVYFDRKRSDCIRFPRILFLHSKTFGQDTAGLSGPAPKPAPPTAGVLKVPV